MLVILTISKHSKVSLLMIDEQENRESIFEALKSL